jgi:hypothetical protein
MITGFPVLPTVTVLLLHHAADELTRHHYQLLRKANEHDAGVRIVPICFAEYREDALPGSYVALDPESFRTNPMPTFHRFHHFKGPLIPDLDCLIWDYVLHGGERTDRIVLAEGDMLSRCCIREFFGPSFRHELSGSRVRSGVRENRSWFWYDKTPPAQRGMLGNLVASLSPVCGIQMSWELAEKMALLAHRSGGLFNNVHVELAIGTMARMLGAEPMETKLPGGNVPVDFIHWSRGAVKLGDWGVFHPIKEIINPSDEQKPKPPLTVVTLWRAGWCDAQQQVLHWLCTEPFPHNTIFFWTVQEGSETASHLETAWIERLAPRQDRGVELVEVSSVTPVTEVERHSLIAGLYTEVLSNVISDIVLLVEDDVVPPVGCAAVLLKTLAGQGPDTAAVMGAYRSRQRTNCICAHYLQGVYIPWETNLSSLASDGNKPAALLPAAWVGGGLTLHRSSWLKPYLPLEIALHPHWVEGCDMVLSSRVIAGGGLLWVLPEIRAQHLCPEVVAFLASRPATSCGLPKA